MKVLKCGATPVTAPKPEPRKYNDTELRTTAPEGVYKNSDNPSSTYRAVVAGLGNTRCVIFYVGSHSSIAGRVRNPGEGITAWVKVEGAEVIFDIKEPQQ